MSYGHAAYGDTDYVLSPDSVALNLNTAPLAVQINATAITLNATVFASSIAVDLAGLALSLTVQEAEFAHQGDFNPGTVVLTVTLLSSRNEPVQNAVLLNLECLPPSVAVTLPTLGLVSNATALQWSGRGSLIPPAHRLFTLLPHRRTISRLTLAVGELLDAGFNWQALLAVNESITNSQWQSVPGLAIDSEAVHNAITSVWFDTATATRYMRASCLNTITTSDGRILTTKLIITIR